MHWIKLIDPQEDYLLAVPLDHPCFFITERGVRYECDAPVCYLDMLGSINFRSACESAFFHWMCICLPKQKIDEFPFAPLPLIDIPEFNYAMGWVKVLDKHQRLVEIEVIDDQNPNKIGYYTDRKIKSC